MAALLDMSRKRGFYSTAGLLRNEERRASRIVYDSIQRRKIRTTHRNSFFHVEGHLWFLSRPVYTSCLSWFHIFLCIAHQYTRFGMASVGTISLVVLQNQGHAYLLLGAGAVCLIGGITCGISLRAERGPLRINLLQLHRGQGLRLPARKPSAFKMNGSRLPLGQGSPSSRPAWSSVASFAKG